jgi:hypothetical protein
MDVRIVLCSSGAALGNAFSRYNLKSTKNLKELREFLGGLDPADPATTRTVVLTTFQSWQSLVLDKSTEFYKPDAKVTAEQEADGPEVDYNPDAEDEASPEAEEELVTGEVNIKRERVKRCTLRMDPETFGVIIIDEAHRVKNPLALQTSAILNAKYILVTATPFKTHVRDLWGLLRFPWKNVRLAYPNEVIDGYAAATDYAKLENLLKTKYQGSLLKVDEEDMFSFLSALDPVKYRKHVGTKDNIEAGNTVVPLSAMLITKRRVKGQSLEIEGVQFELGSDIPHYRVTTVELRLTTSEAALYKPIYERVRAKHGRKMSAIAADDDPGAKSGRRTLVLASNNTMLDRFETRGIDASAGVVHEQ